MSYVIFYGMLGLALAASVIGLLLGGASRSWRRRRLSLRRATVLGLLAVLPFYVLVLLTMLSPRTAWLPCLFFAGIAAYKLYRRTRVDRSNALVQVLVAAVWLLDWRWEDHLRPGLGNNPIRVDLVVLWPILFGASAVALWLAWAYVANDTVEARGAAG